MATVNLEIASKRDWLPANPWLWLGAGGALCAVAAAWAGWLRGDASDLRVLLLALGLLVASAGVWLRFRTADALYVSSWPALAQFTRLGVGTLFALLAVGLTAVFLGTFWYSDKIGLNPGATGLVWLSMAPLSISAARRCWRRERDQGVLDATEESAVAFCILAACCGVGIAALYNPDQPTDWDSLQLVLRVAAAVSVFAGALILASMQLRRLTLSLLFTLHFMGICSAALSAPPGPWAVQQLWTRVFRPYLEFMYLNNAYHFYAPDPGPTSYLWFRVIFESPDGSEHGLWYKVPGMDEKGRIQHPVALEYQRYLSLTESVAMPKALPPEYYFDNERNQWMPQPMFFNRLNLVPGPNQRPVIGMPESPYPRIPLHPTLPKTQQVHIPADMPQRLLNSFARHIAERYANYQENGVPMTFKSVKIYRAVHAIPQVSWFNEKLSPNDPTLFRPYYLGNYLADGSQIVDQDPYLYWLLPILRDGANDNPMAMINDFCRKHAGDPNWQCLTQDWR